ncbi:thiamine pyrophosphate-binding protein [Mesorhizobium sp. CCNWLW179-1]|uniref:thiamine pyrophosphate-binding protein n=1 Tax=unclassified Mesorhizobium TaxID=325217 RepID=UPI0030151FC1
MTTNGGTLVAEALAKYGVSHFFYIMGAPMLQAEAEAIKRGLRGIDVRHEQAAVMMAHAYSRLTGRIAACMTASGPGTTNLTTGAAHAKADCVPVLLLGGSAPQDQSGHGVFQEDVDQLATMAPCVKWSERVYHAHRVPEMIARALSIAASGKPGPVYLDLPADMLSTEVDPSKVSWPAFDLDARPRPTLGREDVSAIRNLVGSAKRPIIVTGGGALWSGAAKELTDFVEATGIPFFTTPQGRGVLPDDHAQSYLAARATAFREADIVLVLGTRMNYVSGHIAAPRFATDVRVARIDISSEEIAQSRNLEIGAVADLKTALTQLNASGAWGGNGFKGWNEHLGQVNASKSDKAEASLSNADRPIHPLRLCKEVRDFITRDTILCVDGQEILNYGRQSIPTYKPGHRMNSGTYGTMGVGMPFGVGAKAARPDQEVVVLHGDGSFGFNLMEFDTAVRHKLPVIVVISLNGGWTGDPDRSKPGRDLGYTRYEKIAEALGGHGEYVENPDDIRPALERARAAVASGKPALVNVLTDWKARATTVAFTRYAT